MAFRALLGLGIVGAVLLTPATTPATQPPAAGEVAAWPATFTAPLASPVAVLVPFRPPASSYGPGHRGVDLAAGAGATVFAAGPGVVIFAGWLVDRGVVSVEHGDGMRTTYEPVTASVTAGQRVAAGAVLGRVATGHEVCAPESCLHWGVRLANREYVDPMSLLDPPRIRLKPWDG